MPWRSTPDATFTRSAVATLPSFRDAYARRRCILPVDGFYEWMATKGGKQPYAIAMKDRSPFGIAGIKGAVELVVGELR